MRAAPAALVLLLVLPALGAADAPAPGVSDFFVDVDGASAHGRIAVPDGAAKGLVVVVHGYSHQAVDHDAHLARLAALGYVAVAMDFGPKAEFPLLAGAHQTEAATDALLAQYGFQHAILYSVSMGTAVAGIVLAERPGVFEYWVSNEGLAMLHETWAGATALSPSGNPTALKAKSAIEAECGGTPAEAPLAYAARSAALRAPEFRGLKGAVLLHDSNDGLVPTNQGRELEAALAAVGVPTDYYQVLRGQPGHEGTSMTGYGSLQVDGMAGHGDESDDAQAMTALSFAVLEDILAGTYELPQGHREFVVDRDLGTLP